MLIVCEQGVDIGMAVDIHLFLYLNIQKEDSNLVKIGYNWFELERLNSAHQLAKPSRNGGFCFYRGAAELVQAVQRCGKGFICFSTSPEDWRS